MALHLKKKKGSTLAFAYKGFQADKSQNAREYLGGNVRFCVLLLSPSTIFFIFLFFQSIKQVTASELYCQASSNDFKVDSVVEL